MLNELSKEIYKANIEKGFDVNKEPFAQTMMLVVTEISEAVEADRKGRWYQGQADKPMSNEYFVKYVKDSVQDEIADAIIRLLDLCGAMNIDIDGHIKAKLNYNKTREYRHGKRY